MKIWECLAQFKIIHVICLSLLYFGTVYMDKILYAPDKTKIQTNINIEANTSKNAKIAKNFKNSKKHEKIKTKNFGYTKTWHTKTMVNTDINILETANIQTPVNIQIIGGITPGILASQNMPENLPANIPENIPENIIDATKNIITIELRQSTKYMLDILDSTIVDGKIGIFSGLKGRHLSKKKLNTTTNSLEKLINETVVKLETKNHEKNLLLKEKTNKFIEKTKKKALDMHTNMVAQMRKSIGQNPEVVILNTKKAKDQIAEFEGKIITKITKFSERLKEEVR